MKCAAKHPFASKETADDSAGLINGGNKTRRPRLTMRSYLCPFCSRWHLTSQPLRRKRAA